MTSEWVAVTIVRTIGVDDDTINNEDRLGSGIQRVGTADAHDTITYDDNFVQSLGI